MTADLDSLAAQELAALEELAALKARLGKLKEKQRLERYSWREQARPEQLPPEGDWRTLYVRGGRGSGKTWTASHMLSEWIMLDPEPGEWGVVAPTYQDAWSICIEGESGLLAAFGTTYQDVRAGHSAFMLTRHIMPFRHLSCSRPRCRSRPGREGRRR